MFVVSTQKEALDALGVRFDTHFGLPLNIDTDAPTWHYSEVITHPDGTPYAFRLDDADMDLFSSIRSQAQMRADQGNPQDGDSLIAGLDDPRDLEPGWFPEAIGP